MPIAEVAGEAAGQAALEEVAVAMEAAEAEGRVIKRLSISDIDLQHLDRDRMVLDEDEMEALQSSIEARGQQVPIDVVRTGMRFGLISGLRRLEALRRAGATEVLALVREPETAAAAHIAMIEENELRANLSFWERANVAYVATSNGVFPDVRTAVATLFARAPAAKRSKIARFVELRRRLGQSLAFPTAIPEKLGLALANAIESDPKAARRITDALRKTPPATAEAERRVLERALKPATTAAASTSKQEVAPGIMVEAKAGRVVVRGKSVDDALVADLTKWLVSHAKNGSVSP